MQFGVCGLCTDESLDPRELARLTEERGVFDSLWFGEHTHIPAGRESPFPDGELPRDHHRTLDPFVALTAAACATERLVVGTGMLLLVARDPIICAKEVASLDRVSGGRVLLGVSGGWNLEELRNHGTDPRMRFALQRERVEAMRLLWSEEEASYRGRFVEFERVWSWPKPVQTPPPVILGGNGPKAEERVFEYGDGWGPMFYPGIVERIAAFVSAARANGRDLPVTVFFFGVGTPEELTACAEAGAARCAFYTTNVDRETVEREFEEMERAIRSFNGGRGAAETGR
jgi:probable F420-dependent oxidoreductase